MADSHANSNSCPEWAGGPEVNYENFVDKAAFGEDTTIGYSNAVKISGCPTLGLGGWVLGCSDARGVETVLREG